MAKNKKKDKKTKEQEEIKSEGQAVEDYRLKNEKNWFTFITKFIFISAAFLLLIFTIMANMGGSNDMLKEAVESFASKSFGNRPATIRKLHNMTFFPSLSVVFEGLSVLPYPESTEKMASIEKMHVKMSFFDMLLSNAKFKEFIIDDVKLKAGYFIQKDLFADKVYIDHDIGNNRADLKGEGDFGPYNWSAALGLEISGSGGSYKYRLQGDNTAFSLDIADLNVQGIMTSEHRKYAEIRDIRIASRDYALAGQATLTVASQGVINVRSTLKGEGRDAVIDLDFNVDIFRSPLLFDGKVKLSGFQVADFNGPQSLMALAARFVEIFISEENLKFYGEDAKKSYIFDWLLKRDYDLEIALEDYVDDNLGGVSDLSLHFFKNRGNYYISGIKGQMAAREVNIPDMLFIRHAQDASYTGLLTQGSLNIDLGMALQGGLSENVIKPQAEQIDCRLYNISPAEEQGWDFVQGDVSESNPVSFSESNYRFVSEILLGRGASDLCMPVIVKE